MPAQKPRTWVQLGFAALAVAYAFGSIEVIELIWPGAGWHYAREWILVLTPLWIFIVMARLPNRWLYHQDPPRAKRKPSPRPRRVPSDEQ